MPVYRPRQLVGWGWCFLKPGNLSLQGDQHIFDLTVWAQNERDRVQEWIDGSLQTAEYADCQLAFNQGAVQARSFVGDAAPKHIQVARSGEQAIQHGQGKEIRVRSLWRAVGNLDISGLTGTSTVIRRSPDCSGSERGCQRFCGLAASGS